MFPRGDNLPCHPVKNVIFIYCHPEVTLSTEAEPRLTILSEGWQSTMSPCKECYIYFIIPNVPFLQQISTPWDIAVWHSKLSPCQLTNQIAGIWIETSTKMYTPFLIGFNLIWTICAFRVLNPRQWSLAKERCWKSWKIMPKSTERSLSQKGWCNKPKRDGVINPKKTTWGIIK